MVVPALGRAKLGRTAGAIARILFLVLLVYFCLRFVVPRWQALQVSGQLHTFSRAWLTIAAAILVAHYLYIFALWLALLRRLGARPVVPLLFRAYGFSLLPKYVPGKIATYGVRVRLALDAGVSLTQVSQSVIWEALLVLTSAAGISLLGALGATGVELSGPARWLSLAFVLAVLVLAVVAATPWFGTRWKERSGLRLLAGDPRVFVGFLLLYATTWLTYGFAHWALARAVDPGVTVGAMTVVTAVCVSWSLGFVSFVAPAGLGVREGVLYVFAVGWMAEPAALLFVTLSRLLSFGIELLLTGTCAAVASGRAVAPQGNGT